MTEPTLQDYLAIVWRRRLVVVITLFTVVAAVLAWSLLQTPQYRASAELLVKQTASQVALAAGQASRGDAVRDINNEVRLLESALVREAVAAEYHGPLSVKDVEVSAPSAEADVVQVSVTSSDSAAATELTNQYVTTFLERRQQMTVDDLLATRQELQPKIDALHAEIGAQRAPLEALDQRILTSSGDAAAALREERAALAAQVDPRISSLQAEEDFYRSQLDQLAVTAQLAKSGDVQELSRAERPTGPVSPKIPRNLVIAVAIGILAGVGLALLVDRMDDSVSSADEVEAMSSLPTLAVVPRVSVAKGEKAGLVGLFDPHSRAVEAYRSLRTSVRFLGVDDAVRVVQITSANAAEGKTFTAANLAIVMAQASQRVLLVDADLRRPRLHSLFGAPNSPGLTTLLLEDASVTSATYVVDRVPGLHLMPSGQPPPNPSELLSGPRARATFERFTYLYDIVIVDSPPILPVTDAQVLSRLTDLTVVVVAHGRTSKRGLKRSFDVLRQVEATVGGTVLNMAPPQRSYGLGYSYRSYHRQPKKADASDRVVQVSRLTEQPNGAGDGSDLSAQIEHVEL